MTNGSYVNGWMEDVTLGPHYTLRLFENEKEVYTATVALVPGAENYPVIGQVVDRKWRVLSVIIHNNQERHLAVERVKSTHSPGSFWSS